MYKASIQGVFSAFEESKTHGIEEFKTLVESTLIRELGLPEHFVRMNLQALITDDWNSVSSGFVNCDFVSESGDFLLLAPYSVTRMGEVSITLSGLYGRVLPRPPIPDLHEVLATVTAPSEPISTIFEFDCFCSFGGVASVSGEAFLAPGNWSFPNSAAGPALNNATEQDLRYRDQAKACIHRVFSAKSAALLWEPFEDAEVRRFIRLVEYQFHEAGHSTGIGLTRKLRDGLLCTPWYGGVEEWRADGVEFELLMRAYDVSYAGKCIAANYVLRFGIDSHRLGGTEQDTDAITSLLTFDALVRCHALYVTSDMQLAFRDESYMAVAEASSVHRHEALTLTKDELRLKHPNGMWPLYSALNVDYGSRMLFEGLIVNPCKEYALGLH